MVSKKVPVVFHCMHYNLIRLRYRLFSISQNRYRLNNVSNFRNMLKEIHVMIPFNVPLNLSLFSLETFLNVKSKRKLILGLFLHSVKIPIVYQRVFLNSNKLSFSQQHILFNIIETSVIPTLKHFIQHLQLSTKHNQWATRHTLILTISNNLLTIRM